MATLIRFHGGGELSVAQDLEAVVASVIRWHPKPVPLEGTAGGDLYVNWDNVLYFEPQAPERASTG